MTSIVRESPPPPVAVGSSAVAGFSPCGASFPVGAAADAGASAPLGSSAAGLLGVAAGAEAAPPPQFERSSAKARLSDETDPVNAHAFMRASYTKRSARSPSGHGAEERAPFGKWRPRRQGDVR